MKSVIAFLPLPLNPQTLIRQKPSEETSENRLNNFIMGTILKSDQNYHLDCDSVPMNSLHISCIL